MKLRINFTWPDGTDDSFIVENNDMDALREEIELCIAERGADINEAWSEEL